MDLEGIVVRGDGRGAKEVVPTMNIVTAAPPTLAYGVYVVGVYINDNYFRGVANFGVRPTFESGTKPVLEVHLFDQSGNWYGERVQVHILHRIREEKQFDSASALKAQIEKDIASAKEFLMI